MTPEEWNRLFDVFHAAREKSGGERVTVLDSACGENTLLRKAVEELLREDEAANGFLSDPLFISITGEPRASPIVPGQRLGRYVTVALIGPRWYGGSLVGSGYRPGQIGRAQISHF